MFGEKKEPQKAPTETKAQPARKAPEPAKPVTSEGKAVVTKVLSKARHAFLTRYDGQGEVFLSLNLAEAKGFKDLQIGQVFVATWVKNQKKSRFDVTDLRSS